MLKITDLKYCDGKYKPKQQFGIREKFLYLMRFDSQTTDNSDKSCLAHTRIHHLFMLFKMD